MANRLPPIPPANRDHKAPQKHVHPDADANEDDKVTGHDKRLRNADEQGDTANMKQNFIHRGRTQKR